MKRLPLLVAWTLAAWAAHAGTFLEGPAVVDGGLRAETITATSTGADGGAFICEATGMATSPCLATPNNGMEIFARHPEPSTNNEDFVFSARAKDDGGTRQTGNLACVLNDENRVFCIDWRGGVWMGGGNEHVLTMLGNSPTVYAASSNQPLILEGSGSNGGNADIFLMGANVHTSGDLVQVYNGGATLEFAITHQGGVRPHLVTSSNRDACNTAAKGNQVTCSNCSGGGGLAVDICDGDTWQQVWP